MVAVVVVVVVLLKFMAIWDCKKNVGCCVLYVVCCVFCVFVCCVFCVVCCVLVVVCCMLYLCVVCYQCVVCCVFCVLYVIQSVLFRGGGGGSGGEGRRKRIQHSKQKPIKAPHNNVGNKANHEQAGTQKHPPRLPLLLPLPGATTKLSDLHGGGVHQQLRNHRNHRSRSGVPTPAALHQDRLIYIPDLMDPKKASEAEGLGRTRSPRNIGRINVIS